MVYTQEITALPDPPTDVGHLLMEPVLIDCPSCRQRGLSNMRKEVVTAPQVISNCINQLLCGFTLITWSGRYDYNHYCGECGCYIGRYMNFNRFTRKMMREQRAHAEDLHKEQQKERLTTNSGPEVTTPLAPIGQ